MVVIASQILAYLSAYLQFVHFDFYKDLFIVCKEVGLSVAMH